MMVQAETKARKTDDENPANENILREWFNEMDDESAKITATRDSQRQ